MSSLGEIQKTLKNLLMAQTPPLKVQTDQPDNFVVTGTKETMQGKKKVDGIYFASVVPKPKDIRFYFFPIYTHATAFSDISPTTRKYLKGKSCFHIKSLENGVGEEIEAMIARGIELYQKDGLI